MIEDALDDGWSEHLDLIDEFVNPGSREAGAVQGNGGMHDIVSVPGDNWLDARPVQAGSRDLGLGQKWLWLWRRRRAVAIGATATVADDDVTIFTTHGESLPIAEPICKSYLVGSCGFGCGCGLGFGCGSAGLLGMVKTPWG